MLAWRIGDVTIERVEEFSSPGFHPSQQFPDFDLSLFDAFPELRSIDRIDPETGHTFASIHTWLVRYGDEIILVDTASGNDKERLDPKYGRFHMLSTDYLGELARHGVSPEDVDVVVNTHMHVDHSGWNTRLADDRWVPTFPNARYIFGRDEFDGHAARQAASAEPINRGSWHDSVLPVVEAGQAEMVGFDFVHSLGLEERVTLIPTPGHTPGHFCVNVEGSKGEGLITGDAIHHPIQFREPHLVNNGDMDVPRARATREALTERLADSGELMLPIHFAGPCAGRIRRDGEGFRYEFID